MNYNELAKEIHENAVQHGWWQNLPDYRTMECLLHSEISEAFEEYRAGRPDVWCADDGKPEGIAVELVDCAIRLLDYVGRCRVDIQSEYDAFVATKGSAYPCDIVTLCHMLHGCVTGICVSCELDINIKAVVIMLYMIRDYCDQHNIDFEDVLRLKHEYNKTRPYRHGGKKC